MGVPRKTMRDIKTLSGRVDRIASPYMAYMQITCLEMERARKGRERASAIQRVENLDARLREIDTEKSALLRALATYGAAPAAGTTPPGSRSIPVARSSGVRIRY